MCWRLLSALLFFVGAVLRGRNSSYLKVQFRGQDSAGQAEGAARQIGGLRLLSPTRRRRPQPRSGLYSKYPPARQQSLPPNLLIDAQDGLPPHRGGHGTVTGLARVREDDPAGPGPIMDVTAPTYDATNDPACSDAECPRRPRLSGIPRDHRPGSRSRPQRPRASQTSALGSSSMIPGPLRQSAVRGAGPAARFPDSHRPRTANRGTDCFRSHKNQSGKLPGSGRATRRKVPTSSVMAHHSPDIGHQSGTGMWPL